MSAYEQTPERVRNARHAYYGMISYIDDKVGQLLTALEATGQADNTIILFVSDHGEMLGERGLWYKMSFFEWSARMPLILHAPARWSGQACKHARVPGRPPAHPHRDWPPANQPSRQNWPAKASSRWPRAAPEERTVYGEMLAEGAIAPLLMIRREQLQICSTANQTLTNSTIWPTDPLELDNLAGKPEFQTLR